MAEATKHVLAFGLEPPAGQEKTVELPAATVDSKLTGSRLELMTPVGRAVNRVEIFRPKTGTDYVEYKEAGDVATILLLNETVTRGKHAVLVWDPALGWLLRDEGSTNGTWVHAGGGLIEVSEPRPLPPGSHKIRVGGYDHGFDLEVLVVRAE